MYILYTQTEYHATTCDGPYGEGGEKGGASERVYNDILNQNSNGVFLHVYVYKRSLLRWSRVAGTMTRRKLHKGVSHFRDIFESTRTCTHEYTRAHQL